VTREETLQKMRGLGLMEARTLQTEAAAKTITETEIIAREISVPRFDPKKDYTGWKAGSPVRDEGQVWLLIQPHNASHFTGRPSTLRALWGLAHTTDPKKAKPYVAPYGTSGLYANGECMIWTDGETYRCIAPNPTEYTPESYQAYWERVEL
jgi:hypothetical protein